MPGALEILGPHLGSPGRLMLSQADPGEEAKDFLDLRRTYTRVVVSAGSHARNL